VRLASLRHVLVDTRAGAGQTPPTQIITVRVAETLEARQQLIQHILRDTLAIQGLMLAVAGWLVWWGIHLAMRPLETFRVQLAARDESDLSAIATERNARELQPLIDTLNGYLQRLGRLIDIRKRFLDNAAHQLRTPLAILKTQLALAERETRGHSAGEAVSAALRTTDNAVHLTEQLLAMTRAEHAPELEAAQRIDLIAMAREVTQSLWQRASDRQQDLGFESTLAHSFVQGVPLLVQEALRNLVDNALVHTGPGIQLTVRVGEGWVEVEDNGHGIPAHHQAHVFERFYRADATAVRGSGLGLAIVQEIARQHGLKVQLTSPCFDVRGTRIRLHWL
jgi:two-component system sensor histidine kinase TctE